MLLQANAENGTNGSLVGSEWDFANNSGAGSNTYSSAAAIHGKLGYNSTSDSNGAGGYVGWSTSLPTTMSDVWLRTYMLMTANYTGQLTQFRYQGSPTLRLICSAANNVRLTDVNNTVIGVSNTVLPIGVAFRLETHIGLSTTASAGIYEVRIYLNKDSFTPTEIMGPFTGQQVSPAIDTVYIGLINNSSAMTLYHDDDALSTDNWPGPYNSFALPWFGV